MAKMKDYSMQIIKWEFHSKSTWQKSLQFSKFECRLSQGLLFSMSVWYQKLSKIIKLCLAAEAKSKKQQEQGTVAHLLG